MPETNAKAALRLFFAPRDRLRLTIEGDRSYPTVKPVWSAPISHPNEYLALVDSKGDEIRMIRKLEDLDPESRTAAEAELRARYLTATVESVVSASQEFGATYWSVETDRGHREFVTQSLQENALWFTDDHLLLIDVDGNRFEIPSVEGLDPRSRRLVRSIL